MNGALRVRLSRVEVERDRLGRFLEDSYAVKCGSHHGAETLDGRRATHEFDQRMRSGR
jgi:hypothetical protein